MIKLLKCILISLTIVLFGCTNSYKKSQDLESIQKVEVETKGSSLFTPPFIPIAGSDGSGSSGGGGSAGGCKGGLCLPIMNE